MKLLSCWHRWEIYIEEKNWKTYAIKKAKSNEKKWAIKREIVILKYLKDKVDFIPKILEYWDDFFKYEFIDWITLNKIKNPSKNIYKQLISYAFILDKLNVEHGELSKPTKNIIVSDIWKVYIIDFERWNLNNTNWKNLKWLANFFTSQQYLSLEQCKNLQKIKNIDEIYNFLITILKI